MAETWWTQAQAINYLKAHYPCSDGVEARWMIERMLEEGTLYARYRRPDGSVLPIEHDQWWRPPSGGAILEWTGYKREVERGDTFANGVIEIQAEPLKSMGALQGAPAGRRGGRPPKNFVIKLSARGAAWLAANGVPDTQRTLADVLRGECQRRGWDYGDTQVREMASDLIREYRAAISRDL